MLSDFRMLCDCILASEKLVYENADYWIECFNLIRRIIGGVDYKGVREIMKVGCFDYGHAVFIIILFTFSKLAHFVVLHKCYLFVSNLSLFVYLFHILFTLLVTLSKCAASSI